MSNTISHFTDKERRLDKSFAKAQDAVFKLLTAPVNKKKIPTYESYTFENKETFFKGTDGVSKGSGWYGGYACESVIPEKWRCKPNGAHDENGFCLNGKHATGGYQTYVSRFYTDQLMNTLVLSNDGGTNILIFMSVEGVGISSGTGAKMRKAVIDALAPLGVKRQNILGCNISSTHCHGGLDTLGMSVGDLAKNKFRPYPENRRSLPPDMENALVERAAKSVGDAYRKLEKGTLSFFETDAAAGVTEKFKCGAKTKNTFSCLLFEGKHEKTLLTNIGSHPVSYGAWNNNQMMCTDYPYYMWLGLKEMGYNLVFTQSAQAAIGSPGAPFASDDPVHAAADEFVKAHRLTKNDWTDRYGYAYSEQWYSELENKLEGYMRNGFLLARFILGFIDRAEKLKPVLNVKNKESLIRFNYGVMQLACVTGLLGGNVVKTDLAPCGFGTMTETNYLEFGNTVVMLTAPGELSPAFVFGSDEAYDGEYFWNGATSIDGENWRYDLIKDTALGSAENKKFMLLGLTNNSLGYILPDNFAFRSMLGAALFYKADSGDMFNCMMLTPGKTAASLLTEQYESLIREVNDK